MNGRKKLKTKFLLKKEANEHLKGRFEENNRELSKRFKMEETNLNAQLKCRKSPTVELLYRLKQNGMPADEILELIEEKRNK